MRESKPVAKPSKPKIEQPPLPSVDFPHAPFIYFEKTPSFGCMNGVVNVTLASHRHLSEGSKVNTDLVAVAYLRCNVPAAMILRKALDDALLMAAPPAGGRTAN
jgi:hypothetical protein